jgi:D-alanyl-D-alanine dipeptidase
MKDDLVFVDEFVSGVRWDAKYATWDNFTGKPVDGYLANRIAGTRALCAALERAREAAASLGFGLLLWDGYRPQGAVDCFLRWSKQLDDGRTKLQHYPKIERAEMFDQVDLAPLGARRDRRGPARRRAARSLAQGGDSLAPSSGAN